MKHNFKELKVWQKSRVFVKEIYKAVLTFPQHEQFGATSQLRRAAFSISLNISEGSGRGTNVDFNRFLNMAKSSALEVENALILTNDLEYLSNELTNDLIEKVIEIQKMIVGLQKSLDL